MKILVTGVAGFIGSHLARALLEEGHKVVGIDNLSIGIRENIPKGVIFYKVDMRRADKMEEVIDKEAPEIIYHLAAWAHEGLSQFMPRHITENNYNAFLNLIVPCIKKGIKRIVIGSSMSVYGEQKPPFNEELERKPEDVYAVAKASMEKTTEILADVHGFNYTIIRPHNVYGPGQIYWDPYRNVVGIFINRILQGKPPIIYGDGNQTRAFSYIDDVTPYILKAAFIDETKSQIINIGPLEEYTINELAESVIRAAVNSGLFQKGTISPLHLPDRPREVKHAFCTNDKARQLLGYKTSIGLDEGVGRMFAWAQKIGPKKFKYLDELELESGNVPKTWSEKIM